MKNKSLKIPAVILVVGLALALVAYMLTGMVKAPAITQHDFDFAVNYQLDGETRTLEGVYRCRFRSVGVGTNPLERYYEGEYLSNPSQDHAAAHTIAQKDGLELCIVAIFSDDLLMGDAESGDFHYDPYLAVIDQEGMEYSLEEFPGVFDAEIVDWVYPQSVDNSFHFVGFSMLHDSSMMAMLLVGVLTILACIIFVKRDKTVPYKVLDKISLVLNWVVGCAAIPFMTLVAWLMQIYVSGDEIVYQVDLCVPAITAFTIAASVALRRKGYTKTGLFIQFIGPVLFVALLVLESVL